MLLIMLFFEANLFLNVNQKCLFSTIFFTKLMSYKGSGESNNLIFYNVFGYLIY